MMMPDDEMRHVLDAAQAEADRQKTDIAAAHLLLGLFHPPMSAGGRVLMGLGVQPKQEKLTGAPGASPWAEAAPDETVWPPPVARASTVPPRDIRLSREAAVVIALAEREAQSRADTRLTPAHLIIGLLEHRSGSASLLLRMHQITTDSARRSLYA